ncbi:hypothetical protein BD408DRAFT_410649 [Parasitella parasitica]|nr:hypothetical protein BD408DRAFT_410649 [Parasitella parasitica]
MSFKAQLTKFKDYFHKEKAAAVHTEPFLRKKFWRKKSKANEIVMQQQTNTVGSLFTMSVPITISTTTHLYGSSNNASNPIATSIVQQLIVLPPSQVYGFMSLVALSLLVLAFAILQIHRTLSIFQSAVDGLKCILVGFASNSISVFSYLKSWF